MRRVRLQRDPTRERVEKIRKQVAGKTLSEIVKSKSTLSKFLILLSHNDVYLIYNEQKGDYICSHVSTQKIQTKKTARSTGH